MNPILDKISQATKMITKFTKAFEITQAQALEDGVIDDDEKQALDELQAQINELDAIVKDHKKTLAANIAEWKGLAGAYATYKTQVSELQERGDENAPRAAETAAEIDRLEKEYFWKDATTAFQAAMAEIAPIHAQSTQLNEIKTQYEAEVGEINARYEALALGQNPNLSDQQQQVVDVHGNMKSAAEQGEYQTAQESLEELRTLLDQLPATQEGAITEAEMETHRGEIDRMDVEIGDMEKEMDELEAALSTEMETEV